MSFGGFAFSEYGYSEAVDTPLDSDDFRAFLEDVGAARCWLLEIDAFSLASVTARSSAFGETAFAELGFADGDVAVAGSTHTLRYSTHGFVSKLYTGGVAGGDADAPYWYDGRLTDQIRIDRRITSRSGLGGLATVFAELELLNGDGGLDEIPGNYVLEGRRAQLYLGRPTDLRADFGLAFSGVVAKAQIGIRSARLTLSDGMAKLERAANPNLYAGSGGSEGGTDLTGKHKPKCWGSVQNVSPPLVNSATLLYQVNDGAISDVPAAYDRGVALTKVGGVPGAGEYSVDTSAGTITLGATPAGTVTCDILGDASGAGYVNTVSDICLRLFSLAGLTTSEIDSTSFANLETVQSAAVGVWVGTEYRSIADVLDELLAGIGAFGGFSRTGAFGARVIGAGSGITPDESYTEEHILDLEREPLPGPVEPIVWRVAVGYQRNYTVQKDLAASVAAARRTFAAEAERLSKQEDSSVQSRHLLAREYAVHGGFAAAADADTEVARLSALWSVQRSQYRVRLPIAALLADIGEVVEIEHSRFRFTPARSGRVLAHALQANGEVEIRVLV